MNEKDKEERIKELSELVEKNKDAFFFLFLAYCLLMPREEFDRIIKSIEEKERTK